MGIYICVRHYVRFYFRFKTPVGPSSWVVDVVAGGLSCVHVHAHVHVHVCGLHTMKFTFCGVFRALLSCLALSNIQVKVILYRRHRHQTHRHDTFNKVRYIARTGSTVITKILPY